jgi:hypothetical protein
MGETRQMHYVPRSFMKNFSVERNGNYFINALSTEDGAKPFEMNTKRVCVQKNIYMLNGETEEQRQLIENLYNELYERDYDQVYKMLTDEKKHELVGTERYSIISFVVSLYYRNNSWVNGMNKFHDEIFERVYYATKANNQDSFFYGEEEISIVGKTLEDLQKENRKSDTPHMAIEAVRAMFKLIKLRLINDVITVVKSSSNHEYIISDNPVIARGEKPGQHIIPIDPTNTLSVPIDKNHLLQLHPWGEELDRRTLYHVTENTLMSAVNVMTNNHTQFAKAANFVLGTEAGLRDFKPNLNDEELKAEIRSMATSSTILGASL